MRVGIQVNGFDFGEEPIGETFAGIAVRAEQAGMASLFVMDHFFQIGHLGPPEAPMLEAWTTLGFAAGRTTRISLGTMVTGVTYRHPGLLVKIATTLDVLSGGRAYLGIGAAWNEEEHRGLGVVFPPLAERFERLEETLRIAQQMWRGDETPFTGRHYQLERPLNVPAALSRPHPPILIGGSGERKTLHLVARYADACNLFAGADLEPLRHKLTVLREHCAAEGRAYGDIEKTSLMAVQLDRAGGEGRLTPAQLVEQLHEQAEAGIDHAILSFPGMVQQPSTLEAIGTDVVPAVARFEVRRD